MQYLLIDCFLKHQYEIDTYVLMNDQVLSYASIVSIKQHAYIVVFL